MERPGHLVNTSKKLEENLQETKKPSVSVFLNAAKYVHACMLAWFEITNCTSQDDSASEFLTSEHESLQAG